MGSTGRAESGDDKTMAVVVWPRSLSRSTSATMAWSSVVWAGKSTSTVRAATGDPFRLALRIPSRGLRTAVTIWRPGPAGRGQGTPYLHATAHRLALDDTRPVGLRTP